MRCGAFLTSTLTAQGVEAARQQHPRSMERRHLFKLLGAVRDAILHAHCIASIPSGVSCSGGMLEEL